MNFILGSSSKSRAAILKDNGYQFTVMSPNINEKEIGQRNTNIIDISLIALDVALAKAQALLNKLKVVNNLKSDCILITSDQIVSYNGSIREKPESKEECKKYLLSYEFYPAETHSALVLTHLYSGKQVHGVDIARQHFKPIPENVIDALIQEGEVLYCCGGFMIDSDIIKPYLKEREGSEDSIMGMPMGLFTSLLDSLKAVAINI